MKPTSGMPNIPIFVYMFRRCGIFAICGSPSKLDRPPVPKNPSPGFRVWQPLQSKNTSELGPK